MSVAQILSQRSYIVPGKIKVTEWFFKVPKDYSKSTDDQIRLFARSAEKAEKPVDPSKDDKKQLPWFLYLEGGPGMGCKPNFGGYVATVLDKGYKLLLLDQRGTGMSSTITAETLQKLGGPKAQVDYLKHFRADNIVRDAEAVRKALTADYPEDKKKWSILGQSFGGYCSVNYLSRFPEGLREVFTSGGLPPLVNQPDKVYEKLFQRAKERSLQYYEKFPEDVERMQKLARYLNKNDIRTSSGGKISPNRLRSIGHSLGFHGMFDEIHNTIFRMADDLEFYGSFTRPTIEAFESWGPFDSHVIYALLHEPCYLSGTAGNWSAERVMKKLPEFDNEDGERDKPILFTAEMITHSTYEDYSELIPLKETGELLAQVSDWPDLYDEEQLAKNEVPVYAAQYYDDLYVDFDYSMETAKKIKGCKVFVTNTMYHDALRSKPEQAMKELFAMREDVRD